MTKKMTIEIEIKSEGVIDVTLNVDKKMTKNEIGDCFMSLAETIDLYSKEITNIAKGGKNG